MLKNYLTVAVRNLLRHKVYSLINILGLAIGMACCILIMLYVQDELSYDRYHKNVERIYRVIDEIHVAGKTVHAALTSAPMAPALLNDYPEVINAVRFFRHPWQKPLIRYGDKSFYEDRFFYADATVFDVFTFPLTEGDPETALKEPYSIVITEEMAAKYFGDEDPTDRIISFDNKYDFRITGILQKVPHNSHFRFDFLASFVTLTNIMGSELKNWVSHGFYTYLLLPEHHSPTELEQQLPDFIKKYMGASAGMKFIPHLQPLARIHLHSHLASEIEPNSDMAYIYIFSAIAFFILLRIET